MDLGIRRWWNRLNSWRARQVGPDDERFIEVTFYELLGRLADPESKAQVLRSLQSGEISRQQVHQLLATSPERQAYWQAQQDYRLLLEREAASADNVFAQAAYWETLGRSPDPASLHQSVQELHEKKQSRGRLLADLRHSTEGTAYHQAQQDYRFLLEREAASADDAFIHAAFLETLGRYPDPESLHQLVQDLREKKQSRGRLLSDLRASTEAMAYQQAQQDYRFLLEREAASTDEAFIQAAFLEFLERSPDPKSLRQLVKDLREKKQSRALLLSLLHDSPECVGLQIVRNLYRELIGKEPSPERKRQNLKFLQDADMDPQSLRQEILASWDYYVCHTEPPPEEAPYWVDHPPVEVQLEVTQRCNMNPPCLMCFRSIAPHGTRWKDMPVEIWQGIRPILRQAKHIGLYGGGEPLVYPHLFSLLGSLDPQQSEVGFHTNGHLLTPKNSRLLIEHQLSWISISMDAATPEIYRRIRWRDDFDQLCAKIRHLQTLKEQLGSQRPRIELNMTLMRVNLAEAPRFVELAAELGADQVLLLEIKPGAGDWERQAVDGYWFRYRDEEIGDCRALFQETVAQASRRAHNLGLPLELRFYQPISIEPLPGGDVPSVEAKPITTMDEEPAYPSEALCGEPWRSVMVDVNGEVAFCNQHHLPGATLGNLRETPFEEIWNGPRARMMRALLLGKTLPSYCEGCCKSCLLVP